MSSLLTVTQDLRALMPTIRDQGPRPLCLAFACSDLNSFHNKLSNALSVECLAYLSYLKEGHQNYNEGLTTVSVISVLANEGQLTEEELPYNVSSFVPSKPIFNGNKVFYMQAEVSVDIVDSLNLYLDKGSACVVCISIPTSFFSISYPFQLDDENDAAGNHAVVVLGKAIRECGTVYFMIRNSWGDAWAEGGHCWLSENFLRKRTFALIGVIG